MNENWSLTPATGAEIRDFLKGNGLSWVNERLHLEGHDLEILASTEGTPLYIYSRRSISATYQDIVNTLATHLGPRTLVCFALKANPHIDLVREICSLGGGADVVSIGEFERAIAAGLAPERIVFSGVGKRSTEIVSALRRGVGWINVESEEELALVRRITLESGLKVRIALRVNPDVDAQTHGHVSTGRAEDKFGIPYGDCMRLLQSTKDCDSLLADGLAVHIGSQITSGRPFQLAFSRLRSLVLDARSLGLPIRHLDLGGGLGVRYRPSDPILDTDEYARIVSTTLGNLDTTFTFEFGRRLVANAGVLLTSILYRKTAAGRRLYISDAGMTDLLRPALYGSYHEVLPLIQPSRPSGAECDVVGPVCESTDVLARKRRLPDLQPGEKIAILSVGAYGAAMASTYNLRSLPRELVL